MGADDKDWQRSRIITKHWYVWSCKMSYLDRVREFSYTSPVSKKTFTLYFRDVSVEGGHKAGVHELPMHPGAEVQDIDVSGFRYPISGYITGDDYDTTADARSTALGEKGVGTLHHPRYGDKTVLCTSFTEKESFVERMKCAVFDFTFVEHTDAALSVSSSTTQAISSAADTASSTAAASGTSALGKTASQIASVARRAHKAVKSLKKTLCTISSTSSSIRNSIEIASDRIIRDVDTLASAPVELLTDMVALYSLPASISMSAKEKVNKFSNSLSELYKIAVSKYDNANAFSALSTIAGADVMCGSVASGTLSSRSDAIDTRDALTSALASLKTYLATLEDAGSYQVPDDVMTSLDDAYTAAVTYLMAKSTDLPIEQVYTCDGEETPLTLAVKLRGSVEKLDTLIDY